MELSPLLLRMRCRTSKAQIVSTRFAEPNMDPSRDSNWNISIIWRREEHFCYGRSVEPPFCVDKRIDQAANLLATYKDRNDNEQRFAYDATKRLKVRIMVPRKPGEVEVRETFTYVPGTSLVSTSVQRGEQTDYKRDGRNRVVATIVHVTGGRTLVTSNTYDVLDRLVQRQDPYGRCTFFVYDINNDRLIRKVTELVPGGVPRGSTDSQKQCGNTDVDALTRDLRPNPPYVIEETIFDSMGQVTDTVDGRGIKKHFVLDKQGRVTDDYEAFGIAEQAQTHRTYDPQGNLVQVIQPRENDPQERLKGTPFRTTYAYTDRNLLRMVTLATGTADQASTITTYFEDGQRKTTEDARHKVTRYRYDSCCGRLTDVIDPIGATTHYDYDANGNRVKVRDPNQNETRFDYDHLNRQTEQTCVACGAKPPGRPEAQPEDEITRIEYDDDLTDSQGLNVDPRFRDKMRDLGFVGGTDGRATLTTNPQNETTLTVADSLGRTVLAVDGNLNAVKTTYDKVDPVSGLLEITRSDAMQHSWTTRQDTLGRERIDPENRVARTSYDAAGNPVKFRDADLVGEDCDFDSRNRRTVCQDTKGDTRRIRYDAHSNQVEVIDGRQMSTTNHFDARDRRTSSTDRLDRLPGITTYAYDAKSNLLRITDAQKNVTEYAYDDRNLRVRETFPSSGKGADVRSMEFDSGRRLISRTDQARATVTYEYDRANRLTARRYPDRKDDTFTYDHASRVTSAQSTRYGTLVQRLYDAGGRPREEHQQVFGDDRVLRYQYDAANRQTDVTYPDLSIVHRTFTDRDQLMSVSLCNAPCPDARNGSPIASPRTYTPGRRLLQTTLGNGLVEQRMYFGDGLLSGLQVPGVISFEYDYDKNKWKTEERVLTAPLESQNFVYDNEGRLVSWNRDNADRQSWMLSVVGDWNRTESNRDVEVRTHNAVHELTSINGDALSHDPKGNLTRDDKNNRYDWDFENRLATARQADEKDKDDGKHKDKDKHTDKDKDDDGKAKGVAYIYDALSRRLGKSTNKTATVFVHDGLQVVAEYENRHLARRYVYGSYVDEPLALSTEEGLFFYTANRQYSVAALTDSHGRVIERYRYDAYGSRTVTDAKSGVKPESSVGNQIGFTGRYHHPDSALIDFRSRQYDPRLGRFIGRDQSYIDGMSLYAAYFVPNGTDPSGREGLCVNTLIKAVLKIFLFCEDCNGEENGDDGTDEEEIEDVLPNYSGYSGYVGNMTGMTPIEQCLKTGCLKCKGCIANTIRIKKATVDDRGIVKCYWTCKTYTPPPVVAGGTTSQNGTSGGSSSGAGGTDDSGSTSSGSTGSGTPWCAVPPCTD